MQATHLKAYVGRGTKLHIGYEYDLNDGRKILMVRCGSRRIGTGIYTTGLLDLATYSENRDSCEKCLDRVKDMVAA